VPALIADVELCRRHVAYAPPKLSSSAAAQLLKAEAHMTETMASIATISESAREALPEILGIPTAVWSSTWGL
jgi:hypothetical protein